MSEIQFTKKNIESAKFYKSKTNKLSQKRKVFKCSIDGYVLKIGSYRVTKTWAIKFAKWILKSFNHD